MPQKITQRYSRIKGYTSLGTFKSPMMGSINTNAATLNKTVTRLIMLKDINRLDLSLSSSRWPKQMENATALPMLNPSKMEVRNVIRV